MSGVGKFFCVNEDVNALQVENRVLLVEHDGYMGYRASQPKEKEFREPNEQLRAVYEKMRTEAAPLFYLTQEELSILTHYRKASSDDRRLVQKVLDINLSDG